MLNIETSIIIKSSPKNVWKILLDFEKYVRWNPFIRNIEGKPEVGSKLTNTMQLQGQKSQVFKPTILVLDEQKEFRWLGHLLVKGIFDGEHYFLLEQINDREVKLIQGENFSGLLSKPIMKLIGEKTLSGFKEMNEALKNRAESN